MSFSQLFAAALLVFGFALDAPAQTSSCIPAGQPAAPAAGRAGRGPAAPPPPRNLTIAAIPGVVAAGGNWTKIWQQAGNSADGILADVSSRDGSVLVAQEDYDTVLRIDVNGKTSVFVANAKGLGSLSMDRQGRLYGAHRTERPGSTKPDRDAIVNAITMLAPDRKTVASKWADGMPLSVRPNDLAADGQGGAYFTSGCLFYASASGTATVAGEDLRTNGIAFSPDDKVLYVTNGAAIVAFDVAGSGKLANRRDFAKLDSAGDGVAVDTEGRLYVTINAGVQVIDKAGASLGVIPTPRGVISVAFAGPAKRTLFVIGSGADDANGQPIREGPQQTAATIFTLPMLAQGVQGRAK
jgi:gluconolactonase